ncbi:hypothetical protein SAMN04487764_2963 [Gillisia sp. Hel1_33_143]|uniref:DUF6730 family protein n=1 Tax=Gillisia sp. Hel1_33_143 TaxID=1336796 RepID=UPI00087CDC2D|nr:DUF6730 family protein [Gillisia sp. Hel1_33_143]SDS74944.1 hypothetical protein SAMN04487764_2963 [Gillisia sp. Hel1_33_143]
MLEWDCKLNSMAKLEQLSELLVSEIEQFEKTIERLEKIQQQKIGIDSRTVEQILQQHLRKLEGHITHHNNQMNILSHKLKTSKSYPIWALTLFTSSLIINGILIYILIT